MKKRPINLTLRAKSVARIKAHKAKRPRFVSSRIDPRTGRDLKKYRLADFPINEKKDQV